jgi:hypothetical protein
VFAHSIDHAEFEKLSFEFRNLQRKLGDIADYDHWQKIVNPMKRYRDRLSALPLPFNYSSGRRGDSAEEVRALVADCGSMFPAYASAAQEVLESWISLTKSNDNPLLDCIKQIHTTAADSKSCLLVIPPFQTKFIHDVRNIVSTSPGLSSIHVGSTHQVCGCDCFDRMIILGPINWFTNSILLAPRAREIHLIRYSWIRQQLPPEPRFMGFPMENEEIVKRIAEALSQGERPGEQAAEPSKSLDSHELLPTINWAELKRRLSEPAAEDTIKDEAERENVQALIVEIEGEQGVLLDATEGARVMVVELDEHGKLQRLSVPVESVLPGIFIIVRTSGGGELIVPIADGILGEESARLRAKQKQWKTLLRKQVQASSISQVAAELGKLGAPLASDANLRNWISYRSIKTENYKDFYAIMCLVGLEDRAKEFWNDMRAIALAHLQAGQHIRKLLLNEVSAADFEELERSGKIDFELFGAKEKSMAIVRVISVSPETISVPVSKINKTFELHGEPWQG